MAELKIEIGSKLYSYCYGPMTVVSLGEQCVAATADDPDGMAEKVKKLDKLSHIHTFYRASIGHWVFTAPADVGKEDDDFPHNCQPSNHLGIDKDYYHAYFNDKPTRKGQESSVGSMGSYSQESPVGGMGDKINEHTGESAVGSRN